MGLNAEGEALDLPPLEAEGLAATGADGGVFAAHPYAGLDGDFFLRGSSPAPVVAGDFFLLGFSPAQLEPLVSRASCNGRCTGKVSSEVTQKPLAA